MTSSAFPLESATSAPSKVAPSANPPLRRPPARWKHDLAGVLLTASQIARRVKDLAHIIDRDYAGREPLIVPLLNGTVVFVADLLRHLTLSLQLDFMGVSSYADSTRPGDLVITKELRQDVTGRDVLVVDDILDSGQTLEWVTRHLTLRRPREIRTCVLLSKQVPRRTPVEPDYLGFTIPDAFVVGYGLDYAGRFRNLPFVGVLRPTKH